MTPNTPDEGVIPARILSLDVHHVPGGVILTVRLVIGAYECNLPVPLNSTARAELAAALLNTNDARN